jgi:membrane protease subunit HflK
MYDQVIELTQDVKELVQEKLSKIESGIKVVQVQLTEKTWTRQVDAEFQKLVTASNDRETAINDARSYAESALNAAAGSVAEKLFAAITDDTVSEKERESLWSQLAGTAQEKISEALSYKTKVVANARANADYLRELLPEYRKHPDLVTQRIYLDAMESIFNNVDEKFVIPKGSQWRIQLNRDPSLKPKISEEQTTQEN